MEPCPTLPLEGLYLYLVRHGFPLSARDYQDAVSALRAGQGMLGRAHLHWLCRTLWARTDQEVSRLDRLFREFVLPSTEDVRELSGQPRSPADRAQTNTRGRSSEADSTTAAVQEPMPIIEFSPPTAAGIGLPRALVPKELRESYIFTARPPVSLRALVIALRRFRRPQRSGPKVELDVDATVADQCRRGMLIEPVLVPARRNQARLIIAVDASPSMVTWRSMNGLLAEALERSQLAHTALYFFDNAPSEELFEIAALTRPVSLQSALDRHPQCALLVLSDAGAARGRQNRERVAEIEQFAARVRSIWHPLAWVNPMPRERWTGTTAERVARLPGVAMFELHEEGLTHAIDYLRGKRSD